MSEQARHATTTTVDVHGLVAPGFEKVADAFAINFAEHGDTGAACAAYVGGEPVVDVWAGETDRGPWQAETRSVLFSVSKGVTTVGVLIAVERGLLDLDAPVAAYWPEFAASGKTTVTARQLLSHRAGLMGPDAELTVDDLRQWSPVAEALAQQAPHWQAGTAHGYHALTFGWLAGELLRRVTGQRPGQWLTEQVFVPLQLDLAFGADLDDPDLAMIGDPLPSTDQAALEQFTEWLAHPLFVKALTMGGAIDGLKLFATANTAEYLGYEIPAGNLVGSARDLARFYAATVSEIAGVRLLGAEVLRDARAPQSFGEPFVGPSGLRWGTGFMIDSDIRRMAGAGSFGHDGAGGLLAFAHLEHQLGFAYQTIRPGGIPDARAELLCAALRACL